MLALSLLDWFMLDGFHGVDQWLYGDRSPWVPTAFWFYGLIAFLLLQWLIWLTSRVRNLR